MIRKFLQSFTVAAILVLGLSTQSVYADEIQSVVEEFRIESFGDYAVSPIIQQEEAFNSVILELGDQFEEILVNYDPLRGNIWESVEVHDDGFGANALLFSSPTHAVQFRTVTGNPLNVKAHFFMARSDDDPTLHAGEEVAAAGIRVIKRAQWGADENLRYLTPDVEDLLSGNVSYRGDRTDPCEKYKTSKYKRETAVSRVVNRGPRGQALVWPLAYSKRIRKIVVHHTDSELRDLNGDRRTDGRDYQAMIQAIYYFHAISRGWGDIGYNYIIDPLGNVYEGRYGGEKVIGAHALCHNNGTIGIAVIGNYENKSVPQPALKSLIKLVGLKAKQYGINPAADSTFRGKRLPNILGHKDVRATSCPGKRLIQTLPKVRERAAAVARSGVFSEGNLSAETLDYNAKLVRQPDDLVLPANDRQTIKLQFKNTGKKTWDSNTWLHVALNNRPQARVVPILEDKVFVAANMKERSVSPGQVGTFEVEFEGGYVPGTYSFELAPVVNGRFKVSRSAVFVDATVQEARFDYRVVQQDLPSGTLFNGQKLKASIQLQNTGNVNWVNYGKNPIRLGTEALRDRRSPLVKQHATRLAHLLESEVGPGETGTFVFDLQIPQNLKGKHRERFTPVVEGVHWLDDRGLSFEFTVKKPKHKASFESRTKLHKLNPGERAKIELELRNKGDLAWDAETMKVQMVGRGLKTFKRQLIPLKEVKPKEKAEFDFWIQAPYEQGQHSLFLRSRFSGKPITGGASRYLVNVPKPKIRARMLKQTSRKVDLQPGEEVELEVQFRNVGNSVWHKDGENAVYLAPTRPRDRLSKLYYKDEWENKFRAGKMVEKEVGPGETATFRFKVKPNRKGVYKEYFQLVMEGITWIEGSFVRWDFHVFGDYLDENNDNKTDSRQNQAKARLLTRVTSDRDRTAARSASSTNRSTTTRTSTTSNPTAAAATKAKIPDQKEDPFRVRLSYYDDSSMMTANQDFYILNGDNEIMFDLRIGKSVQFRRVNNNVHVQLGNSVKTAPVVRLVPKKRGIIKIQTMSRRPAWNRSLNDNEFRGVIEMRAVNGKMAYINELPLEDYLLGLAEVSNTALPEKQKTIAILARTYARFYMSDKNRKFPGMPYDGSDDPAVFQRYLGYGYEKRSPNFAKAVRATEDQVVTYNGELVKTPYFSQSDGRTRSALEVWGWTNTPYLQAVDDPHCKGLIRRGHGVGLSGCGSEALAKIGKKYEEIIKYYYQGVEVETLNF